jgi:hypothetical protein
MDMDMVVVIVTIHRFIIVDVVVMVAEGDGK